MTAALQGEGTPSDTLEEKNGSLTLPLGGSRIYSDNAGKQQSMTPSSNVSVGGDTREEGGMPPPGYRGDHRAVTNTGGGDRGGGGVRYRMRRK